MYIPICWGMTIFEIVIPRKDQEPLTQWTNNDLPTSVTVTISFADPVEDFDGTLEILQEDRIIRNIAIDRTRKPKFVFKKQDFTRPEEDEEDPNDIDSTEQEDMEKNTLTETENKSSGPEKEIMTDKRPGPARPR